MKSRTHILVALGLMFLTCCTQLCKPNRKDFSPEQVVQSYLDISINMKDPSEKIQLLDLTTGVLHSSINSASDETITNAFIKKNYKLVSYSVIERRDRTPRETEITFEIVYFDPTGVKDPKDAPKMTTANTVALIKDESEWKIRDVIGKKTSIEFFVAEEPVKPFQPGETPPANEESPQEP